MKDRDWKKGRKSPKDKAHEKAEMMASMRKKAIGVACAVVLSLGLGGLADAVTVPDPVASSNLLKWNNNKFAGPRWDSYSPYCMERVAVKQTASPSSGTVTRWMPWIDDDPFLAFRAVYVKVVATRGDAIWVRAFGPNIRHISTAGDATDMIISVVADSTCSTVIIPTEVDSLWLWKTGGTAQVSISAY